jgi:hypothetical protein
MPEVMVQTVDLSTGDFYKSEMHSSMTKASSDNTRDTDEDTNSSCTNNNMSSDDENGETSSITKGESSVPKEDSVVDDDKTAAVAVPTSDSEGTKEEVVPPPTVEDQHAEKEDEVVKSSDKESATPTQSTSVDVGDNLTTENEALPTAIEDVGEEQGIQTNAEPSSEEPTPPLEAQPFDEDISRIEDQNSLGEIVPTAQGGDQTDVSQGANADHSLLDGQNESVSEKFGSVVIRKEGEDWEEIVFHIPETDPNDEPQEEPYEADPEVDEDNVVDTDISPMAPPDNTEAPVSDEELVTCDTPLQDEEVVNVDATLQDEEIVDVESTTVVEDSVNADATAEDEDTVKVAAPLQIEEAVKVDAPRELEEVAKGAETLPKETVKSGASRLSDETSVKQGVTVDHKDTIFVGILKNGMLLRVIYFLFFLAFLVATSKSRGLDVRMLVQRPTARGVKPWRIPPKKQK